SPCWTCSTENGYVSAGLASFPRPGVRWLAAYLGGRLTPRDCLPPCWLGRSAAAVLQDLLDTGDHFLRGGIKVSRHGDPETGDHLPRPVDAKVVIVPFPGSIQLLGRRQQRRVYAAKLVERSTGFPAHLPWLVGQQPAEGLHAAHVAELGEQNAGHANHLVP